MLHSLHHIRILRQTDTLMFLSANSICSMFPITTALHWSPLACLSAVCRNAAHSLSSSSQRDGDKVNRRSCSPVGLAAAVTAVTASNVSVTVQYIHIRIQQYSRVNIVVINGAFSFTSLHDSWNYAYLRNRRWGGSVYVLQMFFCCFFGVFFFCFFRPSKVPDNRSRERLNEFSWNFHQTIAGKV